MSKRGLSPEQARVQRPRLEPTEDEAIRVYLSGRYPEPEYLNSLLINPYEHFEEFHKRNYQSQLPNVITPRKDIPNYDEYAIERYSEFQNRMAQTLETFRGFDWNNVVLAGGYVLSTIGGFYEFPGDLDLFIHGLNEQQGFQKLQQIISFFQNLGGPTETRILVRSDRAITIVTEQSPFPIQIILRLYHHPTEILLGFDLPCVRLFFDGQNVYMTRSCQEAIVQRCNIANGNQPFRTGTYEYRLMKYFHRGYDILVPDLQSDRVDSRIFDPRYSESLQLTGLAKLLYMIRYPKVTVKDSPLQGDYNVLSSTLSKMAEYFSEDIGIVLYREIIDAYKEKPSFIIEFSPRYWGRVFDGSWTFDTAFHRYRLRESIGSGPTELWWTLLIRDIPAPEVGPTRFIGNLIEYLQSLPPVQSWYCQAYGLVADCR